MLCSSRFSGFHGNEWESQHKGKITRLSNSHHGPGCLNSWYMRQSSQEQKYTEYNTTHNIGAHTNQKWEQLLGSLHWLYAIQNQDFCPMMWSICMRNLLLNTENKTCAYLLLVGPVAKTSDCSFGKNPCSYFPWPIFISSRWGWMAVWSIFISRCSMDWAAGDSHRWTTASPAPEGMRCHNSSAHAHTPENPPQS